MPFLLPVSNPEEIIRLKVAIPKSLFDWAQTLAESSGCSIDLVLSEAIRFARKNHGKPIKKSAKTSKDLGEA